MLNEISLLRETNFNVPINSQELSESHQKFTAYEICPRCFGYKWRIGPPLTTGDFICQCNNIESYTPPLGWICPKCQKVLSPEIKEHRCDHF